jgi:hypothetical protein
MVANPGAEVELVAVGLQIFGNHLKIEVKR